MRKWECGSVCPCAPILFPSPFPPSHGWGGGGVAAQRITYRPAASLTKPAAYPARGIYAPKSARAGEGKKPPPKGRKDGYVLDFLLAQAARSFARTSSGFSARSFRRFSFLAG